MVDHVAEFLGFSDPTVKRLFGRQSSSRFGELALQRGDEGAEGELLKGFLVFATSSLFRGGDDQTGSVIEALSHQPSAEQFIPALVRGIVEFGEGGEMRLAQSHRPG